MHTYTGRVTTGLVAAITSAGKLPCKHVIHVTGPTKEVDAHLLQSAVLLALGRAEHMGCQSVALPAISSGIFGFPLPLCAKILVQCGYEFANKRPRFVKRIVFVNIDIKTATALKIALEDAKKSSGGAATSSCAAATCAVQRPAAVEEAATSGRGVGAGGVGEGKEGKETQDGKEANAQPPETEAKVRVCMCVQEVLVCMCVQEEFFSLQLQKNQRRHTYTNSACSIALKTRQAYVIGTLRFSHHN